MEPPPYHLSLNRNVRARAMKLRPLVFHLAFLLFASLLLSSCRPATPSADKQAPMARGNGELSVTTDRAAAESKPATQVLAKQAQPGAIVFPLTEWHESRGNQVAYSADGRLLAVASSVGISVYDALTLAEKYFLPSEMWVRALAFTSDSTLLVGGSYDHLVRIWRAADGTLLQTLSAHQGAIRSVAIAPDDTTLASAADDNRICLWNVVDGTLQHTLVDGTDGVRSVAFSNDGTLLAAGLRDGLIRLWRTGDWTPVMTLEGHHDWVRSVTFAPDDRTLASGSFDTTARIWSIGTGELLHTLEGHTASVLSVAFSPDGQTLATASVDNDVRLWRVSDGALLTRLQGHTNFVFSAAYAPDGRRLASTGMDNTVRVWEVATLGTMEAADEAVEPSASVSCVICHHPKSAFRPAPVIDTSCEQCHPEGASLNWDPDIPQDPNPIPEGY